MRTDLWSSPAGAERSPFCSCEIERKREARPFPELSVLCDVAFFSADIRKNNAFPHEDLQQTARYITTIATNKY